MRARGTKNLTVKLRWMDGERGEAWGSVFIVDFSMGFPDSGIGRVKGGLVDRSLLEQIEGLVTIK